MWNLKKKIHRQNKTNRFIDTENNLVVSGGEDGKGMGKIEDGD